MEILDLQESKQFSSERHVYKFLAETPLCSISVVGWEPGQTSPIHFHPGADEIYYIIREWVDYVRGGIDRGMTKEQCVATLTALTDRYPMDVEQDGMAPRVMQMNVANLYDYVTGAGIHQRR